MAPKARFELCRQAFDVLLTVPPLPPPTSPEGDVELLPSAAAMALLSTASSEPGQYGLETLRTRVGPVAVAICPATAPVPIQRPRDHRGMPGTLAALRGVVVVVEDEPLPAPTQSALVEHLQAHGFAVVVPELPLAGSTSSPRMKDDRDCATFTHCYNSSLFAKRVSVVGSAANLAAQLSYHGNGLAGGSCFLLGFGATGAAIATAACLEANAAHTNCNHDRSGFSGGVIPPVAGLAIDTQGFRFAQTGLHDVNFLPGAVKYGDMPGLLALTAPVPMWLAGEANINNHYDMMMARQKIPMPPPYRPTFPGDPPEGHGSVMRQFTLSAAAVGGDGEGDDGDSAAAYVYEDRMLDDVTVWLQNVANVAAAAVVPESKL